MTGWSPSPTPALERPETRRDPRVGSDVAVALLPTDAFARVLDATLERGVSEERGSDPRRDAPRSAEPETRSGKEASARPRPDGGPRDAGTARRSEAATETRGQRTDTTTADENAASETADAAAEDTAATTADGAESSAEAAGEPGPAEDELAALIKLMRPSALRAFQAAVTGGEAEGAGGAGGAARLPAGMRTIAMTAPAAGTEPEAAVPPPRIASQVMQALSKADGLATGRGTVRLTLDPAHLGKVDVTVTNREGRLEVTFRVESAEAEHALRSRSGELGQALLGKAAGWNDVQVTVVREGAEDEDVNRDDGGQSQQNREDESQNRDETPEGREGES